MRFILCIRLEEKYHPLLSVRSTQSTRAVENYPGGQETDDGKHKTEDLSHEL